MNDEAVFPFGKVEICDSYIISEPYEGVTIDNEELQTILNHCKNIFKEKPYGYICRRVNSYSVNPLVYLKDSKTHNVKAVAIVVRSSSGNSTANIEKHFSAVPFQIFNEEEESKKWIIQHLKDSEDA